MLRQHKQVEREEEWKLLFLNVYQAIYHCWKVLNFECQQLSIVVPEQATVHDSSKEVIAYVGGWILACLGKKKGLQRDKAMRAIHSSVEAFRLHNALNADQAKLANIPVTYIETRQMIKGKLQYPSKVFFQFLCHLEATYMQNYNYKMMVSYADGSLLKAIYDALLESPHISGLFKALCPDSVRFDKEDKQSVGYKIFRYVVKKYRNMRVKYFGKSHRAWSKKGEDRYEKGALRLRVAVISEKRKVKSDPGESNSEARDLDVQVDFVDESGAVVDCDEDSDDDEDSNDLGALAFEEANNEIIRRRYKRALEAATDDFGNLDDSEDDSEDDDLESDDMINSESQQVEQKEQSRQEEVEPY